MSTWEKVKMVECFYFGALARKETILSMSVWHRVSNPSALNIWNTRYIFLILIQITEILKKQKDTPQPGESTSQEEHSAVVSSDLPCASDNKNTGKSRCLNWRWVVAKGDVSMAEAPAEHFYLQTHRWELKSDPSHVQMRGITQGLFSLQEMFIASI